MISKYSSRKEWQSLYKTRQWHRLRRVQLNKEPLCKYCQQDGIVTAATVVDHKTAHKGNESLFYDDNNLQSLCLSHHNSTKQRAEKRGVAEIGCDVKGNPISPDHHWNS